MRSKRIWWLAVLAVFAIFHQDVWFWNDGRLVLGLPIGLFYHVAYCLAVAMTMLALVTLAWPTDEDMP